VSVRACSVSEGGSLADTAGSDISAPLWAAYNRGMDEQPLQLAFEGGTLVVSGVAPERLAALPHCRQDPRSGAFRAEAMYYRALVEHLRREGIAYEDQARTYQPSSWPLRTSRDPFPHQTEALQTWWQGGGRGVVVLPTGTGKTHLAVLAISKTARPSLVVTPTIDLLHQWYGELSLAFNTDLGAHNEVLRGRFGDRAWYRVRLTNGPDGPRPVLEAY